MFKKDGSSIGFAILINVLLVTHAIGQWREIDIGTRRDLTSLRVENDFVYTVSNDTLFFSNDCGETWTSRKIFLPFSYYNYFFANDSVGYAFVDPTEYWDTYTIVFKTTNGGITWEETGGQTIYPQGCHFQDENHFVVWGFTIPEYSSLWSTTDGGQTFSYANVYGMSISKPLI
jgi:hypothetical protein